MSLRFTRAAIGGYRRLMKQCHDELPPAQRQLRFISDADIRLSIEDRIHAAWTVFDVHE